MKRKLFSAILFGALLATSTSGLTSCKDYDDDITNLQGQIDKLATKDELSAKANELATSISAAQTAASAAADVAKAAQTAANNASSAADAADKAAKAAADAAKAAQNKADEVDGKLTTAVNNAAQQIQDAVKDLATKQQVTDAVKEVKDKYDAQAKDLKALSDRLAKVEAKLGMGEGGEDIDLTEIQAELEDIEDAFEALVGVVSDMVTSVELVYNSQDYKYNGTSPAVCPNDLDFSIVTEQKNETFGKDVADKILTTAEGHTKFYGDEVIIRVNPVDAEISASDISLINSKGEELTGFVEATKVERYSNKNYLTRAAGANTGLWKVTFAPVDGKKADDLKKKFSTNPTNPTTAGDYIVYGVAVKSAISDSISENRRVVSAYDVTMKISTAKNHVANLTDYTLTKAGTDKVDIEVKGKNIQNIKNRSTGTPKEYLWATAAAAEPAVVPVTAAPGTINTITGDDRHLEDYLVASVGEDIKIEFKKNIKGFYVTLDRAFATESAPSEINAWDGYTYENVAKNGVKATMFEGKEGTIKVSELSHNVTGDIIGFRIYAMNLDGTLVDPDGVAFYVNVGEPQEADIDLGAKNLLVTKPAPAAQTENFCGDFVLPTKAFEGYTFGTIVCKNAADNSVLATSNYKVWYKEGNTWKTNGVSDAIAEMKNVTAVGIQILTPTTVKDNATYKVTIPLQKTTNYQTYTVKNAVLTFTKKLPDTAPAFTWNEGQDEEQIVKTANYDTNIQGALCISGVTAPLAVSTSIKPASSFTAKNGNLNYNDMFIQSGAGNPVINSDGKFIFSLATTVWNSTNNVYDPLVTPAVGTSAPYAYNATIPDGVIDCKTPHAVSATYNYGPISSEDQDPNTSGAQYNWKVSSTSGYSIKYMTWSYKNANYLGFEWATKKVNNVTYTYDVNQTLTNIKIATDRFKAVHGSKLTTSLRKATLKDYLKAGWLQIESVKTIGVETGIENPYYEWDSSTTYTDYTVLGLKKKAGVENIPAHSEKIQITVVDCFGHKETHELVLKFTIEPVNANAWLDPSV